MTFSNFNSDKAPDLNAKFNEFRKPAKWRVQVNNVANNY